MITLHHLRIGRSIFTVWLLEELGVEYDLKVYHRDPKTMRALDDLKQIHPLGKSPVIEDNGLVISESGAITSYLLEKFDREFKFSPPRSDLEQWGRFTRWLHYPEGSVFTPLLIRMLLLRSGASHELLQGFSDKEIALHMNHIADQLAGNKYILGDTFSAADIGISYMISMARRLGVSADYPTLEAYLARNQSRPAWISATERAVE
ncbi:MAG: glutathione S-transferase family protein [Pseudohongiella sp.]|uniref:glutathione S-transferase family protein n=1 Tax=Pseudohongiella sp. TaxID=1979412 RepID=UPI00349FDCCD